MQRLRTMPVVMLMCAVTLAGCSNDGNTKKADSSPSPTSSTTSSSPSPSDTPSGSTTSPFPSNPPTSPKGPGFPHDQIEAASMHKAVLNSSVAKTPEEKAAVAAWMSYWQGAADTWYLYKPTQQFDGVARGKARTFVLDYLATMKSKNERVVGWAKDNVQKVRVAGDKATLQDCTENYTFTVDREVEPLTRPAPFYLITGTLQKEGGRWTVISQETATPKKSCL